MENLMYVVPVVSVLALLFAGYLAVKVAKQEEGTEKMKEIASAISEGARAFLTARIQDSDRICDRIVFTDRIRDR